MSVWGNFFPNFRAGQVFDLRLVNEGKSGGFISFLASFLPRGFDFGFRESRRKIKINYWTTIARAYSTDWQKFRIRNFFPGIFLFRLFIWYGKNASNRRWASILPWNIKFYWYLIPLRFENFPCYSFFIQLSNAWNFKVWFQVKVFVKVWRLWMTTGGI